MNTKYCCYCKTKKKSLGNRAYYYIVDVRSRVQSMRCGDIFNITNEYSTIVVVKLNKIL